MRQSFAYRGQVNIPRKMSVSDGHGWTQENCTAVRVELDARGEDIRVKIPYRNASSQRR